MNLNMKPDTMPDTTTKYEWSYGNWKLIFQKGLFRCFTMKKKGSTTINRKTIPRNDSSRM